MEGNQSERSVQRHRDYTRRRILHQHLQQALRRTPTSHATRLSQSLALRALLGSEPAQGHVDADAQLFPGGLSHDDLSNLSPVPSPTLSHAVCLRLEEELKRTLLSIEEYSSSEPTGAADADGGDRLQTAQRLPRHIRDRTEALEQQKDALKQCRVRVLKLIEQINDTHPALEAQLISALETLPPQLRAARAAHADVLAATTEAALLKLSLLRARAHRALYGLALPHPSSAGAAGTAADPTPPRTVSSAVGAAYKALRARERAQDEEMRALDGQVAAYEGMLSLVDGGREGSFAQVVRDMARVKRETEECRRDLRRLGWTGD
ncbi:hypothetical protein BD413DRAFT_580231 [Trametes elegans]|nr:hypothetical protein BD413DRAFT_580231 [Trametes elegans]